MESWKGIQGANITFPSHVSIRLYSDVDISRWSAGKLLLARNNQIVSYYQDRTFKPTQSVTRAELMAVLSGAAELGFSVWEMNWDLVAKEPSQTFSNTHNYWAASILLKCLLIVLLVPLLTTTSAIALLWIILHSRITP